MIKVKARIYLYKHKGRKTSFKERYRPAFNFDGTEKYYSGHIELMNQEEFALGTLGEVNITFNQESTVVGHLTKGNTFSINEPPIEIREGEILEIIN